MDNQNAGPNDDAPTVHELLDTKRRELADAQDALKAAWTALDTDGVVAAEARIAVIENFITNLEVDAAAANERSAKGEAEARITGCRRAVGSLIAQMDDDVKRVEAAHAVLAEAVSRLNDRYHDVLRTRDEALALADRFSLDAGNLATPGAPTHRLPLDMPSLADVPNPVRPMTEEDQWGMRQRRTYAELRGTKAYEIIQGAGLKPWPRLSEVQARAVESLETRAKRTPDLSALPFVPAEGSISYANVL